MHYLKQMTSIEVPYTHESVTKLLLILLLLLLLLFIYLILIDRHNQLSNEFNVLTKC